MRRGSTGSRLTTEGGTITLILDAERYSWECECGLDLRGLDKHYPEDLRRAATARHKAAHEKFLRGIPLRANAHRELAALAADESGVVVKVAGTGSRESAPLPKLARAMSLVASKGRGWGGSTYYPGDGSTDVYLYVAPNGCAVGYLAVKETHEWYSYREYARKGPDTDIFRSPHPCAYDVFVCKEHRGLGVAHNMAARYAEDEGLASPAELAYSRPFTPMGFAFAQRVAGDKLLIGF